MGRTLQEVIDSLPKAEQVRIEKRYRELKDEVESLQQLRRAAGKAQTEIAARLKIKQPSVSKIEKQTDLYLSTLRNYVEALGGELELIVRLPGRAPLRIRDLGQALDTPADRRATIPTLRAAASKAHSQRRVRGRGSS
jgi:transcriptional regulator with XRE-family HTH domain